MHETHSQPVTCVVLMSGADYGLQKAHKKHLTNLLQWFSRIFHFFVEISVKANEAACREL